MAGNYPDVPGPQMAYDRDGTVVVVVPVAGAPAPNQLTPAEVAALNDESSSTAGQLGDEQTGYYSFVFPELRDVVGYIVGHGGNLHANRQMFTSTNTTNGVDGTWTLVANPYSNAFNGSVNKGNLRTSLQTVNFPGVKAVRFQFNSTTGSSLHRRLAVVHLFGTLSSFAGVDKLRMWHPTLDEPLDDNTSADGAHLDWGDAAQGTTADRTFRIRNNSATLTANSITIGTEVATDASPSITSQITYSDGGAFTSSINIGNLAPGATSAVITVRRTTSLSAELFLWWWRTVAEAGSWS